MKAFLVPTSKHELVRYTHVRKRIGSNYGHGGDAVNDATVRTAGLCLTLALEESGVWVMHHLTYKLRERRTP
jgi:hypothetical protein